STPSQARPAPFIYGAANSTIREIVHLSIGGPQVRVVFTNEFGTDPLTIGAAHVAVSQGGSTINMVSSAGLTFAGSTSVTIPPGALVVSDPASVNVPAQSDLAISFRNTATRTTSATRRPATSSVPRRSRARPRSARGPSSNPLTSKLRRTP